MTWDAKEAIRAADMLDLKLSIPNARAASEQLRGAVQEVERLTDAYAASHANRMEERAAATFELRNIAALTSDLARYKALAEEHRAEVERYRESVRLIRLQLHQDECEGATEMIDELASTLRLL